MPKFVCSYAHDISCYADFVVEAASEQAALRKLGKALREGRFDSVETTPCWENEPTRKRVFVQGPATPHSPDITLEELISSKPTADNPVGKNLKTISNKKHT